MISRIWVEPCKSPHELIPVKQDLGSENDTYDALIHKAWLLVALSIIIFPALTNLVEHAGSISLLIYTVLGIPLIFLPNVRARIDSHEKIVIVAFAVYFLLFSASFFINLALDQLSDTRLKHIDHEMRFLSILPLFLLFRYIRIGESVLWAALISGALISGGYALLSYFWFLPGARVSGSYHPIAFGDLSLALAFMSIPALEFFKSRSRWKMLLPVAAFLLGMTATILSGRRGAWIAIPVLTIILYWYSAAIVSRAVRVCALVALMASATAVYHLPVLDISERIELVVAETKDWRDGDRRYTSTSARIEGWQVAWAVFKRNPAIGAGPGSYVPEMRNLIDEGGSYPNASIHSQPHSQYLSAMAEGGVLGLLALMGVFAAPLLASLRIIRGPGRIRRFGFTLLILVTSFMHFGLTESIFGRNINLTFYVILTALILAVAATSKERANTPARKERD
jgi:O-antigen ligase